MPVKDKQKYLLFIKKHIIVVKIYFNGKNNHPVGNN